MEGDGGLAEGYAAVVGWDGAVFEDLEAVAAQEGCGQGGDGCVLHDSAGQSEDVTAGDVADVGSGGQHQFDDGELESRGEDELGNLAADVFDECSEDWAGVYLVVANLEGVRSCVGERG